MFPSIRQNGYSSSYLVHINKKCFIKCHNLGTAKHYYNLAKSGKDLSDLCEPVQAKA